MKLLTQSLVLSVSTFCFAQNDLPIYENVKFVKEHEMDLDDHSIFISSPFAKSNLNFPKDDEFKGKKIKKITYLYSNNNVNPKYQQSKLSDDRYANLTSKIGADKLKDVEWETKAQVGCGNVPCSQKLDHGFIVEFENDDPIIGKEKLPIQKRRFPANQANVVKGKNGTQIQVPANAFVDAFGKRVEGDVEIQLQEAVTPEDIVLGKLLTLTDKGEVLQSRGMINVQAFHNGNEVYLDKGKSLQVTMATKYEEGFAHYKAEKKDGKLVWKDPELIGEAKKAANEVDKDVVNNNENVNGVQAVILFEDDNQFVGGAGNVVYVVTNVIFNNKKLTQINLTDGRDNWKIEGEDTNKESLSNTGLSDEMKDELAVWFEADSVYSVSGLVMVADRGIPGLARRPTSRSKGSNSHVLSHDVQNAFTMNQMGWANVDRIAGGKYMRLNAEVATPDSLEGFDLSLIIPAQNIFIPGYEKMDGKYSFTHGDGERQMRLPEGEKAYIVMLGKVGQKVAFQMKEIVMGQNEVEPLELTLMEREEAIEIIKKTL
ncbi:hypothetical protein K6119_04600 [Paracrocinitomix mangrovi]|uniref:hypothetical protein n=1 Tax=Paracrocinitomix mangrovi TaxID=2862509 RepID=UPI001C8D1FC2|nr:hypothetical protein [Paracrocinitomix mangrovi]UKN02795.1 hypothetical protein K6119_04600 [Paracrocinitomix mangrovi]